MGLISQLYSLRWLFAAILVAVYVGHKIRTYNRLRAFKGPVLCGWTEAWHAWAILTFKSHLKYDEVCRKYGKHFLPSHPSRFLSFTVFFLTSVVIDHAAKFAAWPELNMKESPMLNPSS